MQLRSKHLLFEEKIISLWDKHKDKRGAAYLSDIYNTPELQRLLQKKYMRDLFHDSLGFAAAKMTRRIVGVAHVEDFESINDPSKRAYCERGALNIAKLRMKRRREFESIGQVISAIQAVKALAWCPFKSNLLASGGGENDKCIKFYNTNIGSCLNSINTGSQVCSLLWNTHEHELLSSHGFTQNQLTLWKYPSMTKIAELTGHTSRVLFMAQSPDGRTVASAAADETLRFWNVFRTPQVAKHTPNATTGPFSSINLIR